MDLRLHPKTDLNASGAVYCRVQGAIGTRKERLKILSGFVMHFTPTSASWQSRVERFFRGITVNRLRRGEFTSVAELVAAIDAHVAHQSTQPKPVVWTKTAADILQKVILARSWFDE